MNIQRKKQTERQTTTQTHMRSRGHSFQIPVAVFVVLLEKERGQLHSTGCHLLSEEDLMHTAKESHAI
jgi:hypothetical protein